MKRVVHVGEVTPQDCFQIVAHGNDMIKKQGKQKLANSSAIQAQVKNYIRIKESYLVCLHFDCSF